MRRVTLSLLMLVVGVEVGILLDHFVLWRRPTPAAPATAAPVPDEVAPAAGPAALACDATASFSGNIYPSLLLSLGKAYPDYARCLTIGVINAVPGKPCEVRVESNLFQQPLLYVTTAPSAKFDLTPDLPWDYGALRKVIQLRPELFVVSASMNGRPAAQTTLTCMVHPVNEAVSRVYDAAAGSWQDTSVCFAAYVNENDPWINSFIQEVMARGEVQRFSGYEFGLSSVMQQLQAVWNGLAAHGLRYVDLATVSGGVPDVNTQYVRFRSESLRDLGANCVDASVLLASIFRRIGLRPVLLFKPGHCFVAVYDAADGGKLIPIETTMISSSTFTASMTYGEQEMETTLSNLSSPGYSSVDIVLARQEGVVPIGDSF